MAICTNHNNKNSNIASNNVGYSIVKNNHVSKSQKYYR